MSVDFLRSWISFGLINLLGVSGMVLPAIAAVPPKPTAQGVQPVVKQLLNNRQRFQVCPDSFDLAAAQRASIAYPVDRQTYLVVVQCFLAAYQGNYEFFLYTPNAKGNPVQRLTLTEFTETQSGPPQAVESSSIGGLPTFDPKQRLLTIQTKYRGLGDCGATARYRLNQRKLKLVDFKAKFACDGKLAPYTQIFPKK